MVIECKCGEEMKCKNFDGLWRMNKMKNKRISLKIAFWYENEALELLATSDNRWNDKIYEIKEIKPSSFVKAFLVRETEKAYLIYFNFNIGNVWIPKKAIEEMEFIEDEDEEVN